ncbi:YitT family protein [Bacillus timonensis]|nr:YitT family protein [Bacillus timonensis]
MAFGIVLTIKANFGASPWDVFHIGLYKQLGLTIGSWSIIAGFVVLLTSSILLKALPQLGAFLNMLFVGLFIDMYMMIPLLRTPVTMLGKITMLIVGIGVIGYGIGLYISARCGAGPRDSLMLALTERTGLKVQYIRGGMELIVLLLGWLLGGPVFWGTFLFSVTIGPIVSYTLPQCQYFSDSVLNQLVKKQNIQINHLSN